MSEQSEAYEQLKAAIERWHRASTDQPRVLTSWIVVAAGSNFDDDGDVKMAVDAAAHGNTLERIGLSHWMVEWAADYTQRWAQK